VDELWQRYRTFWTPVLIGLGIFLVGVIAVHILSDNPEKAKLRMRSEESKLKNMQMPDPRKARTLKERERVLKEDIGAWSARLNQTGGEQVEVVVAAAKQALRAAILRGASDEVAEKHSVLAQRFDDDEVAAAKAHLRFTRLLEQHDERLRTGDPNVAFSRLRDDVWSELRVRANRADVELNAEQLGFGAISSVSRATLPGRVLNLALVARVCDTAIRYDVDSIDNVQVSTNIEPGSPDDFLVLWPVDISMVGDMAAIKQVLDVLTDPQNPVPLENTRLAQPKRKGTAGSGQVELSFKASSVIVRPDVDLNLDAEEDE
jgi:hypothetical protein